jgi:tRNA A-37 threonylcarbamoyl transferase component Bud32
VIKQALEKLRVEADWFSDPSRIHREALGLRWFAQLVPGAVPELIFEDIENQIVAMRAVPQPHENWKTRLLCGQIEFSLVRQFGELIGHVHRLAFERCEELEPVFADRSFFESLRVEPYYRYTATRVPDASDFLRSLIAETWATRCTLVHGDYSPKNVLVHRGRLVLLDYEVIHWGDPAFDLGFSLTHLLSKAHHVAAHRDEFAQAARLYWQSYAQQVDGLFDDLEARTVRHTLGCLLARVDGRSPLEYLSDVERERQRKAVVALMHNSPATVDDLVNRFFQSVGL